MKVIKSSIFCCLIICLPLVCNAESTDSNSPEALDNDIPPIEQGVIDRTVVVTQLHIAQARGYIHRNAPDKAKREIVAAQKLMHTLRYDLSSSVAGDGIAVARKHLEYESAQRVLQDLPAIYHALDQAKGYLPTEDARQHLAQAEKYLKSGDKPRASKELAAADGALPEVEMELPLLRAEKYVVQAANYLAAGELKKADAALGIAEQRMLTASPAGESPLQQAERNLRQASRYSAVGQFPEAKRYLDEAARYLALAAKTGMAAAQQEVAKLSEDLARMKGELDKGDKDRQSIVQSFWERGKALAERSGDYLAARLEKGKSGGEENQLIEARLHVAYAKSYQLTAADPETAVKEIERAQWYLAKVAAKKSTDTAARRQLAQAVKELEYLKAHPEKSAVGARQRYDSVKSTLKELIQKGSD
jgi:hypothetical protein